MFLPVQVTGQDFVLDHCIPRIIDFLTTLVVNYSIYILIKRQNDGNLRATFRKLNL